MADLEAENARLKKELEELQKTRLKEKAEFEDKVTKEHIIGKAHIDQVKTKTDELEGLRSQMVRLTRQLDDEVTRRDQIEAESQSLERRLHELESGAEMATAGSSSKGGKGITFSGERPKDEDQDRSVQVSTKLMRVVDQWMHTKDLQQALLRGAGVTDLAFSTLVQVLSDCKSLQMLDLGQNQLTMDSCSDICRLITTSTSLSFISIAENLFSLRSIGYFMTAVMERQNKKKLAPLEVLDIQGNEGFVIAASGSPPDNLLRQVADVLGDRLPYKGDVLLAQVMRELWRFLHYTEHPQVLNTSVDEVNFASIDTMTIRKMENALAKILLMSEDAADGGTKTLHGNLALAVAMVEADDAIGMPAEKQEAETSAGAPAAGGSTQPAVAAQQGKAGYPADNAPGATKRDTAAAGATQGATVRKPPAAAETRDPFSDLKMAFEPPKEKLKTFNLKQIVTRHGAVLMNMLERLLETTEIDARDVETDQTLLEYACVTGNLGLAKLCYRREANLSNKTKKGYTYFNIVTKAKRYDLMEFLHTYGPRDKMGVNHQDNMGTTALHIAAANNDVDAICRLIEWGADVNLYDFRKRTPLHTAARKGKYEASMLLLELGADMNAKDAKEYTAVAHAEAKNHFALMDRLVYLGGKGHGLQGQAAANQKKAKSLGQVSVTASMLKSSSLGRIGKVAVKGLPGQLSPRMLKG